MSETIHHEAPTASAVLMIVIMPGIIDRGYFVPAPGASPVRRGPAAWMRRRSLRRGSRAGSAGEAPGHGRTRRGHGA